MTFTKSFIRISFQMSALSIAEPEPTPAHQGVAAVVVYEYEVCLIISWAKFQ